MKKFVRVMLIIAAVLAAAGIGLSVAGAVMGGTAQRAKAAEEMRARLGGAFDYFYTGEPEEDYDGNDCRTKDGTPVNAEADSRSYQLGETEKLEITLRYDELILDEHDGAGILVEVRNDPKEMVHVKESGDTLKITSSRKFGKKRQVKVSCPKNWKFREVELGVGAGNVEVRSSLSAEELKVTLGAGEFTNSGSLTAAKTELEVGAGSMTVKGLHTKELDGHCGVGELSVEISGKEADYSYALECGIGSIFIGGEEFSGLGKEKNISHPGAEGELGLECGIGSIDVSFTQK